MTYGIRLALCAIIFAGCVLHVAELEAKALIFLALVLAGQLTLLEGVAFAAAFIAAFDGLINAAHHLAMALRHAVRGFFAYQIWYLDYHCARRCRVCL